MPIYTVRCPDCGLVEDHYYAHVMTHEQRLAEMIYCPACTMPPVMEPLIGLPAQHQVGGVEGKILAGEKLRARNDAHAKSKRGRDEFRAGVEAARARGLPT